MTTYGIWSEAAGGFIETDLRKSGIDASLNHWVSQGEDPEDLEAKEVCADHPEQPADACEECEW